MTRIFLGGAFLLGAMSFVFADQQPRRLEDPQVLHVETRVVQVDVVATDSRNRPITNLSKQDFVLTDNGKRRTIDIFSANGGEPESAAATAPPAERSSLSAGTKVFSNRNPGAPVVPPHSAVIVLDQVNSFFDDAATAQQSVLELLHKLPADEQIALYVISRPDELLMIQDYTVDHDLVVRSLAKFRPRHMMPRPYEWVPNIQDVPGRIGIEIFPPDSGRPPDSFKMEPKEPREQYFNHIWQINAEAARLSMKALAEHLAHLPGRKDVYWVTQAFPARFLGNWDKTLTALNEANVAVNPVDSRGLFVGSNVNSTTTNTMFQIAEGTGGKLYHNRNDIGGAIAEGMAASRVSYTLGFYLPESERDEAFHTLKITTARAGVELRYRQGYLAGNSDSPTEKTGKGDLESALINQVDSTGVGLTADVTSGADSPGGDLQIKLTLDSATLSLRDNNGVSVGTVAEEVLEQDASGHMLAKISDSRSFEISAESRADYEVNGVSWPVAIQLMPGAAKVTVIVRDSVTGKIGSLTIPLK